MVSLVLVSHSRRLAEGLAEMVSQVAGSDVRIAVAAGTVDGRLGTNATAILEAVRSVATPDGVIILLDLGSAALSVEMALEELTLDERAWVAVSSGPLVEGAVVAAVQASVGASLPEILSAANEAAAMPKLPGAAV
jgi:dihydroxyacetone kinase phosphotransfer subunit